MRAKLSELFSSGEARAALGDLPKSTFEHLVRAPYVEPKTVGRGRGKRRLFSLQRLWALCIARALRKRGQSVETATDAARFLLSLSPDSIDSEFAAGRHFIVCINGAVPAILVDRDAITKNPQVKELAAFADREGIPVEYFGLDVRPLLDQLIERIEQEAARASN